MATGGMVPRGRKGHGGMVPQSPPAGAKGLVWAVAEGGHGLGAGAEALQGTRAGAEELGGGGEKNFFVWGIGYPETETWLRGPRCRVPTNRYRVRTAARRTWWGAGQGV